MTTTMTPPPIPGFRLGAPCPAPSLRFSGAVPNEQLTERHRPATLAEMVGQGAAVYQLETFLEAPSSRAFLFSGPTGVGKTTAARALANDLGVDPDWGLSFIRSAEADFQAVDDALRMLRHTCPAGSGWKAVIVDESDLMTPKASHAWLSALEDLPPRSIVIFTTNAPERFPDRFLDRCERIDFAADGETLVQDAQALVDRVWKAETGRSDSPRVADLPNAVDRSGRISFRRVVSALDPLIRGLSSGRAPAGRPAPSADLPPGRPVPKPFPSPRRHPRPAPPTKPIPRPRPSKPSAAPPAPMTLPSGVARVDAKLAALDSEEDAMRDRLQAIDPRRDEAEFTAIGLRFIAIDRERAALKRERAALKRERRELVRRK